MPLPQPYFESILDEDPSMVPLHAYADDFSQQAAYDPEANFDVGAGRGMEDDQAAAEFAAREAERAKERAELLGRLNTEQHEAVTMPHESALVLAAAGSGKTSVLTARIAQLVTQGNPSIPANSVMAVTFTNKASQEMQHRLRKLLDKRSVNELWVGTFHSLCNRILRENHEAAGLPKNFAILDTDGQEAIVRTILKDFGLTKASVKRARAQDAAAAPDAAAVAALQAADPLADAGDGEDAADEFVTPGQCVKFINGRKEKQAAPKPSGQQITTLSTDVDQMETVYAEYQVRLEAQGLLDFQDLLTRGTALLKANDEVRAIYQDKFRAILVDEFQDTNDIQFEWLNLMKGKNCHVMAVGDDDQSIYAFRGADPKNMGRFLKRLTVTPKHPKGRLIRLEQNYRSLPHILAAANAIIDRNTNRLGKVLRTGKPDHGERIDLVTYANAMAEASAIANSIHRLVREEGVPPSEVAILYRTNQQSRLIEQELNKRGVPLTVYGGFRFYERQEVKHILSYLDLVCDMDRDLSFMRVANFPPRGIGERTLEELRQSAQVDRLSMMELVGKRVEKMEQDPKSIGNAASQKKVRQLQNFTNLVLDLADEAIEKPLSQLIDSVIERAGLRQHYLDEAGSTKAGATEAEERLANMAELVSAAKQFELDNPQLTTAAEQLPEYLSFVALMTSTSESDMSKKNTVSLMTVHSSKGLEFDHVYIAGVEEGTFPHARAIKEDEERGNGVTSEMAARMVYTGGLPEVDENGDMADGEGMQEERRLMYVAITRARTTLTISHACERLVNGNAQECEPSRFLLELPAKRLNPIDDRERTAAFGKGKPTKAWRQKDFAEEPRAVKEYTKPYDRMVAIIGTAGRDKDAPLTKQLWERMVQDARSRVHPGDALVSGGAAWADHLAVRLYLDGHVKHLQLHLPAPFTAGRFEGPERESAGSAANYYHDQFSRQTGVDGLVELQRAIDKGASVTFEPADKGYRAMFVRNTKVADAAQALIAYTFGAGDTPADGGTNDTWNQATQCEAKIHVPLHALLSAASEEIVAPAAAAAQSKAAAQAPAPVGTAARTAPSSQDTAALAQQKLAQISITQRFRNRPSIAVKPAGARTQGSSGSNTATPVPAPAPSAAAATAGVALGRIQILKQQYSRPGSRRPS